MKKNFLYIVIIIAVTAILVFAFDFFNRNNSSNGFNRTIKKQNIKFERAFLFPGSSFYFAGLSERELYFKDSRNASALFSINYSLSRLNKMDLILQKPLMTERGNPVTIGLLDTLVYAVQNQSGELNVISKNTGQVSHFKIPKITFIHARLISKQSIVGKSAIIKGEMIQRILTKINYKKNKIEREYQLEKQVDGLFCTDGMLHFDTIHSKLLYMYFYRGEFLCLDTNMNLLYKSKTIDTVKKAVMNIVKINKEENHQNSTTLTQSTPAKPVNRNFTIYKNCIYIMSALKADNEWSSDFKNNQVVDVYSIETGKYLDSFYIPKYKGQKIREFRVAEGFIFATFNHFLVKYIME